MVKSKRGWHNPAKYIEPTTEGHCPYCNKPVNSLENHIHDKHKGEKPLKRWPKCEGIVVKKAQITPFLLVVLVILISISILMYIKSSSENVKVELRAEKQVIFQSGLNLLKSHISNCIDFTLAEAIDTVGLNESAISDYIEDKLVYCIDWIILKNRGFEIVPGQVDADTVVNDLGASTAINFPITIKFGGTSSKLDKFQSSVSLTAQTKLDTDSNGVILSETKIINKNIELTIPEGTIALDADGNPLSRVLVNVMSSEFNPRIVGFFVYGMEPDGATFDPQITLTIKYDESKLPEGGTEQEIQIRYYDDDTTSWVSLPTEVDAIDNVVTAKISHFSDLGMVVPNYYVGLNGNDDNDGSLSSPWKNINYAMWKAEAPATVYVFPGEYYNVKDPTYDLHISLKDGVNLICKEKHSCIIRGGIYGASYSILDGFKVVNLPPESGRSEHSTNEIFCGVSRYGSPITGNIIFPGKYDIYPKDCVDATIKNNIVTNNQIRVVCEVNQRDFQGINHQTNEKIAVPAGTKTECRDIQIENNQVTIDIEHSQFWGLQVLNLQNGLITNNQLRSGKVFEKNQDHVGKNPHNPASILIENSQDVAIKNNRLEVQCHPSGAKIGYGIILYDREGYDPSRNIITEPNDILGCYRTPVRDFNQEPEAVCGDSICHNDELFNEDIGTEYSCPEDCCGDGSCDWPESVSDPNAKGGQFYCAQDC